MADGLFGVWDGAQMYHVVEDRLERFTPRGRFGARPPAGGEELDEAILCLLILRGAANPPQELDRLRAISGTVEDRWRRALAEVAPGEPLEDAVLSTHAGLEAEVDGAIGDDPTALGVYLDWLHERGDPRGDLGLCARAGDRVRAIAVRRRHAAILLGPFATLDDLHALGWGDGFLRRVLLHDPGLLPELVSLPAARFLEELAIHPLDARPCSLAPLLAGGVRRRMRLLEIDSVGRVPDVAGVATQVFPRLRSLFLRGSPVELPEPLPELLELDVAGELEGDALAESSWPSLVRLTLRSAIDARAVLRLFDERMPRLRHLTAEWLYTDLERALRRAGVEVEIRR
jgi:hypothetical protein